MKERIPFGPPIVEVQTSEMSLEEFHRYRAEYIKEHGERPQIDYTWTPHYGGIDFERPEEV